MVERLNPGASWCIAKWFYHPQCFRLFMINSYQFIKYTIGAAYMGRTVVCLSQWISEYVSKWLTKGVNGKISRTIMGFLFDTGLKMVKATHVTCYLLRYICHVLLMNDTIWSLFFRLSCFTQYYICICMARWEFTGHICSPTTSAFFITMGIFDQLISK